MVDIGLVTVVAEEDGDGIYACFFFTDKVSRDPSSVTTTRRANGMLSC